MLAPITPALSGEAAPAPGDWPRYARDLAGTRFSPLDQINKGNVAGLDIAWSFVARPQGGGALVSSATPIAIDGVLYYPVGDAVVALDGASGKELWRYPVADGAVRRAVSYWAGDGTIAPRIFFSSGSAIIAVKAATGELDTSFGNHGQVALTVPYNGPPTVFRNVLVIGANTAEDPIGLSGNSRAYDARTGAKIWEFNTVPQPGEVGHESWLNDGWKGRSGTNVWVWYMTADETTGTIYMPVGGPSPNYYGGDRPGNDLFGNSIVAVDAQTGKYKWHFQTIHHDLWDWDMPPPPVLFDVHKDGKTIPALAETGKNGFMYILNRETGEPIHGVVERPVAAGNVPGEWYSPTQPFPVKPQQLSRGHWDPEDMVTAADTSPEHVAACKALLDSYGGTFFNSGSFTPFFYHEDGKPPIASINMPHNGGSNWGGSAADPAKGVVYVNTSEGGSIGWVEKRKPGGDYGRGTATSNQLYDRGSLSGPGAYASFSANYTAPDGTVTQLPCIKPPWGRLTAVDANTGEIAWQTRLGITEALPKDKQGTGALNTFGGPIVTAGGLVFIGATGDRRFRAFDASDGKELWEKQLTYSAQAVPITYQGKDGRQYVAVTAANFGAGVRGPDGKPLNTEGLVVFALPKGATAGVITTPEGAKMDDASSLAYKPGELTEAQLMSPMRPYFAQHSMNVFRRYPREDTAAMVKFYTEALALKSLNPIQLTATQQMILTGVGSGQIKLSAGQQGNRKYDLTGGYKGGSGIRMWMLTYPDESAVVQRFVEAGFTPPVFASRGDGTRAALVKDPGGFDILLVIRKGAKDGSNDGVGVGIGVTDVPKSRAFYREFVGLDELPPIKDKFLGVTLYPYRHDETTLYLFKAAGPGVDNGSAGIQYVVSDAAMAEAKGKRRGLAVETPLNKLKGFDLTTIWLNDPDGVTNYFAQIGAKRAPPAQ
ncbi:MAG: PQQ-binding-like beta-propeller repeat protein [Novosphingobium sp.]|nr:PQQ-binding-like beta-propeller repeat protein [Novosphingobium sp.]